MKQFFANVYIKSKQQIAKSPKLAALVTLMLALAVTVTLLVGGKSTATAENETIFRINSPDLVINGQRQHMAIPVELNDGLPLASKRSVPTEGISIAKNAEVTLTPDMIDFAHKFGQYLAKTGNEVVVTSGERSPEAQLDLIKDRVEERNANDKFPELQDASLEDTKVWVQAWKWLRGQRVPVNAPKAVAGEKLSVSNHLKGMAMDFVGKSLDDVRAWVVNFQATPLGKTTKLRVTTIAREPGCVHINLAPRA